MSADRTTDADADSTGCGNIAWLAADKCHEGRERQAAKGGASQESGVGHPMCERVPTGVLFVEMKGHTIGTNQAVKTFRSIIRRHAPVGELPKVQPWDPAVGTRAEGVEVEAILEHDVDDRHRLGT